MLAFSLRNCAFAVAALSIPCSAALAQDECATATPVVLGGNGPFDSTGSTVSAPAWTCSSVSGGDVWYSFAMPALGGLLTIDTEGSTGLLDTVLEVWDGCGGTVIGCDDDSGTAFLSRLSFAASGGVTYFIRIGGFGSAVGLHNVNVALQSPDECTGATPISDGLNGPFNTTGATTSAPPSTCSTMNSDIWLSHVASCDGVLTVNTETAGSSPLSDTVMEAWDACGGVVIACDDDGGPGLFSQVSFPVLAGTTYYFRVGDFGASVSQGLFKIRVSNAAAPGSFNDECACAAPLVLGVNAVDTTGSTVSSPSWSCAFVSGGDLWYRYTVAGPGCVDLDINTFGSGVDTTLELWDACGGNIVDCNDDTGGFPPGESQVTVANAVAGTTYLVRAGRFGSATGPFTINVVETSAAPVNDDCAGALPLALGSNGPFNNSCALAAVTPAFACSGSAQADLWFTYTAACTAPHTFQTCASSFDTILEVLDGTCGALTSIGCNDDVSSTVCGVTLRSRVTASLTSGVTYYVRVAGFSTRRGDIVLDVATGTGAGTATVSHVSTCANVLTLAVSGSPNIGGSIDMAVANDTGIVFCAIAFPPTDPILAGSCGSGCLVIGAGGRDQTFGNSRSIAIPCSPIFIGAGVDVQAFEAVPATPGCTFAGVGLNLTDIWSVVIG